MKKIMKLKYLKMKKSLFFDKTIHKIVEKNATNRITFL